MSQFTIRIQRQPLGNPAWLLSVVIVVAGGCAQVSQRSDGGLEDVAQKDSQAPRPDVEPGSDSQAEQDAGPLPDAAPGPDASGCGGGCVTPPNDCYEPQGSCVDSTCVYPYKNAGEWCTDNNSCTTGDECDGQGHCVGDLINCTPAHTHGGTCQNGTCVGITCDSGWGDCDSNLEGTGCETPLNTSTNCTSCGTTCTAGSHATADCSSGSCVRSCVSPWENCDGNWGNGCEIPEGVANQCNQNGLTTSGCGTAWCGTGGIVNFSGNWTCVTCTTCHEFSTTDCSWCQQSTGNWYYPTGTYCNAGPDPCGSYADLVCNP